MSFPPPFSNPLLSRMPTQPQSVPFVGQKFGFFTPRQPGVLPGMPPLFRPRFRPNFIPREPRPPPPNIQPVVPSTATTVFIGNISDKCEDRIIQEILRKCGSVCNWKRLQDSSGKFKAFGFCDFMYPDGAKKALNVLKDFPLGDKRLNVKADEHTEKMLEEFAKNKAVTNQQEESDEYVKAAIEKLLKEEAPELVALTVDEGPSNERSKEKSPGAESAKSTSTASRRSRSSSSDSNHRRKKKNSSKRAEIDRKRSRRHSVASSDGSSSESSSSSIEPKRAKHKKRAHSRRKSPDSEDSMELEERRRLKKEIKEREESYLTRLKKWEEREKRMAKLYEKEREEERQRQKTLQKEAKKLRQFLEDYVDERDDPKYYKGSALFQRKRNYEREREADAKSRQEERKELEEIRKSILEEEHAGDAKGREEEEHDAEERGSKMDGEMAAQNGSKEGRSQVEWDNVAEHPSKGTPSSNTQNVSADNESSTESPSPVKKIVTTLQQKTVVPFSNLNGVFQEEEEEVDTLHQIKKKIKPFEITHEDRIQSMTPEERKKMIKDLIARIPTDRAELFAFNVCWDFVDENLMEQRVRPWVNKKICEYIGEEEPSLVSFICDKISGKSTPEEILQDLSMVLDDEAEVFMVKLWRLIVYESEAKRLGLSSVSASLGSNSQMSMGIK